MTLNVFNTISFLQTAGYLGLFLIVAAETSVFVGFFLPGDSLLFTAGFLSSLGYFNIGTIILVSFIAAVIGDNIGYAVGRKYGAKIFYKQNSLFLDKDYIGKAESFYKKHGGKTIIIARYLPIVRVAAPVLAGVGKMKYSVFFIYNLLGAILWTIGMNLLGYYLGKTIPNADHYIVFIIISIIGFSIAPVAIGILRDKDRRKKLLEFFKQRTRKHR
jgi:membrane-associated protein